MSSTIRPDQEAVRQDLHKPAAAWSEGQETPPILSLEALRQKLDRGDPIVLLEALPEAHLHRGHLPGARHFPHDRARQLAPILLPDRTADLVVYCASATCRNSHIASAVLRSLDYTRVSVFAGGKQAWQEAGLPLET